MKILKLCGALSLILGFTSMFTVANATGSLCNMKADVKAFDDGGMYLFARNSTQANADSAISKHAGENITVIATGSSADSRDTDGRIVTGADADADVAIHPTDGTDGSCEEIAAWHGVPTYTSITVQDGSSKITYSIPGSCLSDINDAYKTARQGNQEGIILLLVTGFNTKNKSVNFVAYSVDPKDPTKQGKALTNCNRA